MSSQSTSNSDQARRIARPNLKGHKTPKKPKMSEEQWNTAVTNFRSVIEHHASDDRAIQQAWSTLRQKYGDRFDAKVSPQPAGQNNVQQHVQPFSLWVIEHLDQGSFERVLRVVFAEELAQCDHLTLLKSTASMASTTMWHLLLYFGVTVFSDHLLSHIRKRVRVFDEDANGTWAFPEAYTKVLQAAALRQRMILDTTIIPSPEAGRLFMKSDLTSLAPANPEFDKSSQRKVAAGTAAASTRTARVQDEAATVGTSRTIGENGPNAKKSTIKTAIEAAPRADAAPFRRESPFPGGPASHNVALPSIESDSQRNPRGRSSRFATRARRESEGKQYLPPSNPPEAPPRPGVSDPARRKPEHKARAGPDAMTRTPDPALETSNAIFKNEPLHLGGDDQSAVVVQQPRALSTIHVRTDGPQRAAPKQPVEGEDLGKSSAADNRRDKRANTTSSRSSLLENNRDWDDDTILHVLKQLAATCPGKWTVIDGMRDHQNTDALTQLKGEDGEKGSLLVALKPEKGKRLLVAVDLKPTFGSKQGILRYYDPAGPPAEDSAVRYKPVAKLESLLSHVLPDRNFNQAEWATEHCVCPELVSEEDGGLAICLAAMYVVGSRLLPEEWDWGFWRYLVLGGFFPDDRAVQLHINHYRDDMVQKLIRQGDMSDGFLAHRGGRAYTDEVEYLGTAAMNPMERMEWREENSMRILAAVHEGYKVFQRLQEHIDLNKAFFKVQLDKNAYIQEDICHKIQSGSMDALPKVEQNEQSEQFFNIDTPQQQASKRHALCHSYHEGLEAAHNSIQKAISSLTEWRRMVMEAVAADDDSLLMRSIE